MGKESKLRFNGTWRSYQKRILDDLNQHLNDSKLHVVAAPGAGKTTLGIEVIARINRPALILCPTNTIKSQWRERICSSFLEKQDYGLVSTDIREPSLITVITYQALLAAFCGNNDNDNENGNENGNGNDNDNENDNDNADTITASSRFRKEKADEVIARLRQAGVSLLCFDEAHHLRNEWWKALTYLNEHLKPEQSIALTATPPYDVEQGEWKRYNDLCGDIDEVISIPELVKNGDLCPHQDFVYFSFLKQNEWELIKKHKENVKTLIEIVRNDKELLDLLSAMRFLKAEDADLETILDQPGYYVAIASLLSSRRYRIPDGFLRLFDSKQKDLPPFNTQRAADFLNGFLHPQNEYTEALEAKRTYYLNLAKRLGLVANNKIVLDDTARIRKQIAGSLGKLDSIIEIAKLESQQLRDSLRMVILADFIRLDDITCSQLGVMPIWRKLEEALRGSLPMGVLCGSIMLLPKTRTAKLHTLMVQRGMSADAVAVSPFKENEHYITVTPKESARNLIVAVITDMFNEGDINVLIGTQALLGEGWDAPSINSLILSSTVSSYMLSNQMRGRAIRIDKNNPAKVSNIWHLATIGTPSNPSLLETLTDSYFADNRIYTHDLTQLETRFRGYEAPSYRGQHEIISGIERVIDLSMIASSHGLITLEQMATRNQKTTLVIAADRELTRQWWKDGLFLGYGEKSQLSTGVQESPQTVKSLLYTGYKALAGEIIAMAMAILFLAGGETKVALFIFAIAAVLLGLLLVKYLKTGTVTGVMKQISIIILETLSHQGKIKTSIKNVGLTVNKVDDELFVSCSNLPMEENNLFIQSLQEFLDPIENPRYLLVRHEMFMKHIRQTDYFSIPSAIATNKEHVNFFKSLWEKHIGKCDVVYTRNTEGRKLLLKARSAAFSAIKRKKSKRLSKWQ